jgi:thiol-disulfide isomerase/thioredoxin
LAYFIAGFNFSRIMDNKANRFDRAVEIARNLSIIAVSLIGAAVLIKNHLLHHAAPSMDEARQFAASRSAPAPALPDPSQRRPANGDQRAPAEGTKISLSGVTWGDSNETVLLALSDRCHFCTESAPFYQQLAREVSQHKNVHLIAVFPQDATDGKKYLDNLGVPIDDVRQATLDSLGVRGTPTLLILDKSGAVKQSWVGRLTADRESEVLSRIKA